MNSRHIFPIKDVAIPWMTREESMDVLLAAINTTWDLPAPNKDWTHIDMTSDAALSHFVLSGVAAHWLVAVDSPAFHMLSADTQEQARAVGAAYIVDSTSMAGLPVRQGFEAFGAAAYFDDNVSILKIFWSHGDQMVSPGDADWEHAKFVFRSSLVVGITAMDHLVGIHLTLANFVIETSREALHCDHPLRRLLKPYSYRTFVINKGAMDNLLSENCLLHRTTALTWEGLKSAFRHGFGRNRFMTMSQRAQLTGLPLAKTQEEKLTSHFSLWEDLLDLERITLEYTRSYLDVYYPTERDFWSDDGVVAFVKSVEEEFHHHSQIRGTTHETPPNLKSKEAVAQFVATFITCVTGVHHHVGNVAEYLTDASVASPKLRPGKNVADIQGSFQSLLVSLLTGRPQPHLINDFSHLLLQDGHFNAAKTAMDTYQEQLVSLAEAIDARNAVREYTTDAIQPRTLHSSVSI